MTQKNQKFHLNLLDWGFIAVALIAAVYTLFTSSDAQPLYLAATLITLITGVFYMILGAKGRRSNFIFCIINTLTFAFVAYANQFYGSLAINLLYYLPCSFIGFYLWGRNSRQNHEVIARKLALRQAIIIAVALIIGTTGLKFALDALGGTSTFLDSLGTISAIIANLLVLARYREQWLVWMISDLAQLALWGFTGDPAMIALRILYPITAIYGYINWRKLVKSPKSKSPQK